MKKHNFKETTAKSDVIWLTLDNSDASRTLSQHAYRNKVNGEGFLGDGQGNISLCNRFIVWDGNGGPQRIEEYLKDAEPVSAQCCKTCLRVFGKLSEPPQK